MKKEEEEKPIPPEPNFKRIPVRIDKNTVLYVKEGEDIEAHVKKFKERPYGNPGYLP